MKSPVKGSRVTCIRSVEAYGSNYGPKKGELIMFRPGMVGTVVSIAPKVCKPDTLNDPRYDRKDHFLVVDFIDRNGALQRCALNYCNAQIVDLVDDADGKDES